MTGEPMFELEKSIKVSDGSFSELTVNQWYRFTRSTNERLVSANIDGSLLFLNVSIRNIDNGFVGPGTNDWKPIEFKNLSINKIGERWDSTDGCATTHVRDTVTVSPCFSNTVKAKLDHLLLLLKLHT